ncbi:hypothetical protein DB345_09515 [Spartobacteria bacterium LR76]|nr:hypothetical protein DB345_09515 [Spartobacteria bacterium LR76]
MIPGRNHLRKMIGGILLPTLFFALLAGAATLCGQVVEDFESSLQTMTEPGCNETAQCLIAEDRAANGNHALKLSWDKHQGSHVGGNLASPGVTIADAPGVYEIAARVNFEQCGSEIGPMAIRLVDANNETFQYLANVEGKSGEPGWTEIKWSFDTNKPVSETVKSWGENANETVDFPIKFLGFAVPFHGGKTEGGALLFDDLSVTKVSD